MKVVINDCFGGFGLSDQAFEMLMDRRGIEWEKVPTTNGFGSTFDYYEKGHAKDDNHYLWYRDLTEDRSDTHLVQIVEELGEKANGRFAELKIVEIPNDVEWFIAEYDGSEHVAEKHRTWY